MNWKKLNLLVFMVMTSLIVFGQDKEEDKITNRIFMPSIQMGVINHLSDEITEGLFIQTSVEYQTPKGIFFRINYDDFDSDYQLDNPQSSIDFLKGKVSFSEFIGGVGYRKTIKKHNIIVAIQSGFRFYGYPIVQEQDNNLSIELDNRNTLINRYTIGYEYEIDTRAFLTIELFGSNVLERDDYWADNAWARGGYIGDYCYYILDNIVWILKGYKWIINDENNPKWSPDGKFMYFLSDRSFTSLVGSPWGTRQPEPCWDASEKVYHVALKKGTRSPFREDEELMNEDKKEEKPAKEEKKKEDKAEKSKDKLVVTIDKNGIQSRIMEEAGMEFDDEIMEIVAHTLKKNTSVFACITCSVGFYRLDKYLDSYNWSMLPNIPIE